MGFTVNLDNNLTMKFIKVPEEGDPSNIKQHFTGLNINLLCCRYWWLSNWESRNMSFPYWRIYWNKNRGSYIRYEGKTTELTPETIVLIPPYTPFSSYLKDNPIPDSGYCLEGGRIDSNTPENNFLPHDITFHLFIHFNLGFPFDFISPQIFSFAVNDEMKTELLKLTTILQENFEQISAQTSLIIFKIIILTVSKIPDGYWNLTASDQRIIGTLRMIDEHLDKELTNETLAHHARMAVNSFARLFKSELGMPPQQFIKQRKIQKASILLHHSNNKIDEIAKISGFCDRFHFTKAFKESTGLTPPQYRKRFYSGKR